MSPFPFQFLTEVVESPQMNALFRLLTGLMVALIVALGQFPAALANGGDVHLDDIGTGIPVIVVWIGGGVLGGLLLFIFIVRRFSKPTEKLAQDGGREKNPRRYEGGKG